MTSAYRSRLKINVTLVLRPSLIICSIAGTPSAVAGIFTNTFGRLIRSCRYRADSIVPGVSRARSGATSTDAKPSPPSLAS